MLDIKQLEIETHQKFTGRAPIFYPRRNELSGSAPITADDLRLGFWELDRLARQEYGSSLAGLLDDTAGADELKFMRLGRLVGVAIKEPFAARSPAQHSDTGAYWSYSVQSGIPTDPRRDLWQYRLIASLVIDPKKPQSPPRPADPALDPYGAGFQWVPPPGLNTADERQMVAFRLEEMHSERRTWRHLRLAMRRYLCGDEKVRARVENAAEGGGLNPRLLTPEGAAGTVAVSAAQMIDDVVPWLDSSSVPVTAAVLIFLSMAGLNTICMEFRPEDADGEETSKPQSV